MNHVNMKINNFLISQCDINIKFQKLSDNDITLFFESDSINLSLLKSEHLKIKILIEVLNRYKNFQMNYLNSLQFNFYKAKVKILSGKENKEVNFDSRIRNDNAIKWWRYAFSLLKLNLRESKTG